MSISSILSSSISTAKLQANAQATRVPAEASLKAISQALATNDLDSAKTATASVAKQLQASSAATPVPVQTAVATLSQAINSGNVSTAKEAFAHFQVALKSHHFGLHAKPWVARDANSGPATSPAGTYASHDPLGTTAAGTYTSHDPLGTTSAGIYTSHDPLGTTPVGTYTSHDPAPSATLAATYSQPGTVPSQVDAASTVQFSA